MAYISTRGKIEPVGFIDAVLMGLADDGGLLVPAAIPAVAPETLESWRQLRYTELALEIFTLYVGGDIPRDDLRMLVERSYGTFRRSEVAPLVRLNAGLSILELFHGPTFAFKDVALQFLGNLYEYIARKTGSVIHILGATSGDTGASAIEGVRGKAGIRICILHPAGKVSKVQELQMTTVTDDNVLNLAVDGNFDDCQRVIKELFADVAFKREYHLRAINSINFARILAQTVYYFWAWLRLTDGDDAADRINISVPTGNFGNIFAGYLARKMGLPIGKLILATNENNILQRFVSEGVYEPAGFRRTHSPSMDIQVASNFERYLYYLFGRDGGAAAERMDGFRRDGRIVVQGDLLAAVQRDFAAYAVSNDDCLDMIAQYRKTYGYLLDPHTACGVKAAERLTEYGEETVALATAHPAKFDEAVRLTGISQQFPAPIAELAGKPQRQTFVGGTGEEVAALLAKFYAS